MRTLLFLILNLALVAAAARAGEPPPPLRRKELIFGLDGCRPDALEAASTPSIDSLRAGGAWSFVAQTGDVPISGPGWSSAFTGVWRDKHGVDDNSFAGARFDLYPNMYCRLNAADPAVSAASIVRWDPLAPNLFAPCPDSSSIAASDAAAAQAAIQLLQDGDPDILFVHLNSPDSAGHASGFSPTVAAYLQAIETNDAQIGTVLAALRGRPRFAEEDWLIMVTTDHGGSGTDHHDNIPANRTIFLIVSGRRAAPGEIVPAPGIVDVAATALAFLGLQIDPAWDLDGRPVGLLPDEPPAAGLQLAADCTQDGKLNLSDPICLLNFIFLGTPGRLPCGDGTLAEAGNEALLDANGDAVVDISDAVYALIYLFGDGLPPAGGQECAPVSGCPDTCS